ncbi:MAG TPA: PPC domain-containing DNA-binding protein [Verrucomicrobiae bacterium]|nr:PPC domain-containing DNA-binding protein [Verrucomicrobiae bacterium]
MKKLILIFAVIAATSWVIAEETRTVETKVTTPADDSKANSDAVPDVYAINGQFDHVVILRFKYQTDLLTGLETMAKQQKIRNGVILSGIGSVRGYHVHSVVNRTFPSKDMFVKDPTAPADLISVNGYIIDGRVHAHATFATPDKAFGGHLEHGTEVFTFAVVTVGVLKDGVDLSKVDDKTYR